MKRILIFTALFSLGISVFAQEYYYWYKEKKVSLELMPTRKFILLASPDDTLALKNRLTEQDIYFYPFEVTPINGLKDKYIDRENDCRTIIEGENWPDITSGQSVLYEAPGFKLTDSGNVYNEVCSSHLFYVQLFQADDFDAANQFYETHLFESAEPELLYYNLQASTDPYFPDQWGLKNTGQYEGTSGLDIKAEQAWTKTTGNPDIRVAIYDHGFEMNHPDLVNNVYGTGYDAQTNTTPAQVRGSHGTACAGIAGAQQNNAKGISGASPDSKLISISINLLTSDTPQQLANGFNWAWKNGADVISNLCGCSSSLYTCKFYQ